MTSPSTERGVRHRRRFASSFKAKIVLASLQGDVSIAELALQHRLNTNLVQTWVRKTQRLSQLPAVPDLVPLPVPAVADVPARSSTTSEICIELPQARARSPSGGR